MPVRVVDASAAAAVMFGEPGAETVAERLVGAHLLAPPIIELELANVCVIKSRRRPDQRDALREAFRRRHRFGIEIVAIDPDAALDLAGETGLTAYDAVYLWVARQAGAELVTLDRELAAAAARLP